MNNDQSFLGGMQPVNNGGVPNNNINDGTVIPGAGLMPVGGPSSSPSPAPTQVQMGPVPSVPVTPTPVVASPEVASAAPVIPDIIDAPNNSVGVAPVVPGIVDASNTVVPSVSPAQAEQPIPNIGLGIVSGNDVSSNIMPSNNLNSNIVPETNNVGNNGIIGVDAGSVVPGGSTSNGENLMNNGSSPFDIGLGPATISPSMGSNSIMSNGGAAIVSNSNDSKPFTNESANASEVAEDIVSVKDYLVNIILFSIPIVGLILMLVKVFSKKENKNVSNFAKAYLVLQFVMIIFGVAIMVMFPTMLLGGMSSGT